MPQVFDRTLLDFLERLGGRSLERQAWRVCWASREPLESNSAAGRWNPASAFGVIYMSLLPDGALAEVYHHLSRAPVFSSATKYICELQIKTKNTLCLDDVATLSQLGLGPQSLALTDVSRSQELGAAAHLLEYDSLLVPSARWPCLNLVVFPEHLDLDYVQITGKKEVNWPAWRELNAQKWEALIENQRRERLALIKQP